MRGNSPRTAADAFRREQQLIVGCVTDRGLHTTGFKPSPIPHQLAFLPTNQPIPLRLHRASRPLRLTVRIEYQIDALEAASTTFLLRPTGYSYRILEASERELLVYHWHPFGASPVRHPHAHLSSRIPRFDLDEGVSVALSEMHIPTGFVTLVDLVRLLIEEFGVQPRRPDWKSILDDAIGVSDLGS